MLFTVAALAALAVAVRGVRFIEPDAATTQVVDKEWIVVMDATRMADKSAMTAAAATLNGKAVSIGDSFRAVFVKNVEKEALFAAMSPLGDAVRYVEPNARAFALATGPCEAQGGEDENVSWGQVRTSGGESPDDGDGRFHYDSDNGDGTTSYVIDTGIFIEHVDFEDRAVWGTNTIDNTDSDGNGHGTHCASTVGGKVWGIAKKTALVAVKVLSASGGGTWQSVIEGMEWAANDRGSKKATANMSLGGGSNTATNEAANAAAETGLLMIAASGNSNSDACRFSPAGAEKVFAVGATTLGNSGGSQTDVRSSFSNYGECQSVFAPGSDITGAWIGNPEATRTISGTSMASPHVCGVANALLSQGVAADKVYDTITSAAHQDVITLNCNNASCESSDNLLLTLQCED